MAEAFKQMLEECQLSQEELAKTLGKSRSTVTNIIRLNNLQEDVKKMVMKMPKSKIITVHMDAINHCTVSRKNMHDFVKLHQYENNVWIPYEGDKKAFK